MTSSQPTVSSESLDDFFLQNFEIKYQSPHEIEWGHRRIILLGEIHTDLFFRRKYSSLIDAMSKTHSIVILVEGEKSMSIIKKNASAQTCFISSNVTIYGWDDSTPKDRYPEIPQIDECTKLYLKYELKLLESETETNVRVSKELKQKADEILKEFNDVQEQFDEEAYMEAVKENFPNRTESMIDTIKRVVVLHPKSKIFVIAGRMHVIQEIEDDSQLSLRSLCQCLDSFESMTLIRNSKTECSIC